MSKLQNLCVRLTTSEDVQWHDVFGDDEIVYYLVAYETSKQGVAHSHSAVTLDRPMSRSTIISRIQKRYPDLKGNAKISVKKWDGNDEYLRYCCKPEGTNKLSEKRVETWGTRLDAKTPQEYRDLYLEKRKLITESRKKKKEQKQCVPWCVEQLRAVHGEAAEWITYQDVVHQMYRYYAEHREGWVEGNNFTVQRYARQIRYELCHGNAGFRKFWIAQLVEQLTR